VGEWNYNPSKYEFFKIFNVKPGSQWEPESLNELHARIESVEEAGIFDHECIEPCERG
jgi:hypothetical protein